MKKVIVVAGGTGNLGLRIVKVLVARGAEVRAVVRSTTDQEKLSELEQLGVTIYKVNQWTLKELTPACLGASCVVSALAGLREVIIDAQTVLLNAALAADVPRFIPSDYSLDFTKFHEGENRNLDLRREFHKHLDRTTIKSTTIFNGAFMDMLTDQMPLILFKQKLILYWGNADHKMGFTTMDNTAAFTAAAALDETTPRYQHIAGDQISPRELKTVASEVTGEKFRLFRPGGKPLLGVIIKVARKLSPSPTELYPAWQGMQYMHNMIDKRADLPKVDNDRYPEIEWTRVRELLEEYKSNSQ